MSVVLDELELDLDFSDHSAAHFAMTTEASMGLLRENRSPATAARAEVDVEARRSSALLWFSPLSFPARVETMMNYHSEKQEPRPPSASTALRLTHFPSHWTPVSESHPLATLAAAARLEPTHRTFHDPHRNVKLRWTSRGHRKGIPAQPVEADVGREEAEKGSVKWKVERRSIRWWGWDTWDISWWIAFIFASLPLSLSSVRADTKLTPLGYGLTYTQTLGSVFWCINGILFFGFFDRTTDPYTHTESATAFLGGTTFLIGAYLGWVETLNPARDADFEWVVDNVKKTLREPSESAQRSLGCERRHFGRHLPLKGHRSRYAEPTSPGSTSTLAPSPDEHSGSPEAEDLPAPWRWYGTSRSLGYIANTVQLFGASAFFISVLCGLPGVLPESGTVGGPEQSVNSEGLWIALYWAMQIVGAPCFVFAGAVFALEVQEKWWKPKLLSIGWQIGFWNIWGGVGFFVSPIFGIFRQTSISNPNLYQYWGTGFATFLGSWAFLIGSYIQLWEALNKRE